MTRLWEWVWRFLETRLPDLTDTFDDDQNDDADSPDRAVAWVACPECGQALPITLSPVHLDVDDDGQQVAVGELLMDDVWAHVWTHDDDPQPRLTQERRD